MLAITDSVLYEALPYALVAFALVLTYRYLKLIDLTFAASFVAGPAIAGSLLVQGGSFGPALLAALAVSAALACVTLSLMWALELDGLLAGLLTSFGGVAVALIFTQGTLSLHEITTPFDALKTIDYPLVDGTLPLHPSQIGVFLAVVLLLKIVVDRFLDSELGLAFRAMEDDRSRSFLLPSIGVSELRMLAIGVVSGNMLCAAAGMMVMLKEGQVTAGRGFDVLISIIAAYLLGIVLFERRASREGSILARWIARIAVFRPSTAAFLGLLFYFILLSLVARTDLPSSTSRLFMLGLIVASFVAGRWRDIVSRWTLAKGNRTYLVPPSAPFEAISVNISYPGYPNPARIVRDLNLQVPPHTVVQLRGPNGAGKSTLLKFLAGLLPGEGTVNVPSRNAARRRRVAGRRVFVGYVSQDAWLASSSTLTVQENLALFKAGPRARFWKNWKPAPAASTASAIAALVAKAGDVPAGQLSGGQRQVLNIAGLIVRPDPPDVILLDEPLTHLDEENAIACVELIERMAKEDRVIVIVQHDISAPITIHASSAQSALEQAVSTVIDIESLQSLSSGE